MSFVNPSACAEESPANGSSITSTGGLEVLAERILVTIAVRRLSEKLNRAVGIPIGR
jgi:hypothetical protein